MLGLAEVGNVILIGGGGNIVAAKLPHVLHVRLVAPLEQRLQRAREIYGMSPKEAHEFCVVGNAEREQFIQTHYRTDINDATWYHLVINTALMSYDATAKQIEDALWSLEALPKSGENWSEVEGPDGLRV
jgi:cytidylate kinase